jgi:hypothetical protein
MSWINVVSCYPSAKSNPGNWREKGPLKRLAKHCCPIHGLQLHCPPSVCHGRGRANWGESTSYCSSQDDGNPGVQCLHTQHTKQKHTCIYTYTQIYRLLTWCVHTIKLPTQITYVCQYFVWVQLSSLYQSIKVSRHRLNAAEKHFVASEIVAKSMFRTPH